MPAREGVIRLMDEARADGLLVGVCSAATKSSAICVLESLLGEERFSVSRQAIQQKPAIQGWPRSQKTSTSRLSGGELQGLSLRFCEVLKGNRRALLRSHDDLHAQQTLSIEGVHQAPKSSGMPQAVICCFRAGT